MQRRLTIEELLSESGWLRTLAGHLVSDASRADDLVQDTWFAALRRPPARGTPPRPWLARVLRNQASNTRRAEQRRAQREGAAVDERELATPASAAEQAEAQRMLAEEIVRLPEELRTVVVLRYFRALDSATIARELAIPAGTVRWRLAKALDELRAALDRRSGGERSAWAALLARHADRAEFVAARTGSGFLVVGALLVPILVLGGYFAWQRLAEGGQSKLARAEASHAPRASREPDEHDAVAPTEAAREAVDSETEDAAGAPGSLAGLTDLEISGVVLVNGRAPERPIQLHLYRRMGGRAVLASKPTIEAEVARFVRHPAVMIPVEARGVFRFTDLSGGFQGELRAAGFRLRDGQSTLPVSAPAADLELHLVSAPAVFGTIVGPLGESLGAELPVVAMFTAGEGQDPAAAGSLFDYDDFETEAGGYFCREVMELGVPRAAGLLLFEFEQGYRVLELPTFDTEVGLDLGTVQLEPVRSVNVRVVDAEGAPVPGACARVVSRWTATRASEPSDEEGRAQLGFAPARPFELRVDALRYATTRVAIVNDEEEVVVTLQRAPAVELRVRAAPETDLSSLRVIVQGPEELVPWLSPWYANWLEGALRMQLGGTLQPQFEQTWSGTLRYMLREDGRVFLEGLAPSVPFSIELQDEDRRVLATRTSVLGPGEWQELEIDLTH